MFSLLKLNRKSRSQCIWRLVFPLGLFNELNRDINSVIYCVIFLYVTDVTQNSKFRKKALAGSGDDCDL